MASISMPLYHYAARNNTDTLLVALLEQGLGGRGWNC